MDFAPKRYQVKSPFFKRTPLRDWLRIVWPACAPSSPRTLCFTSARGSFWILLYAKNWHKTTQPFFIFQANPVSISYMRKLAFWWNKIRPIVCCVPTRIFPQRVSIWRIWRVNTGLRPMWCYVSVAEWRPICTRMWHAINWNVLNLWKKRRIMYVFIAMHISTMQNLTGKTHFSSPIWTSSIKTKLNWSGTNVQNVNYTFPRAKWNHTGINIVCGIWSLISVKKWLLYHPTISPRPKNPD